jgi:hypothetical protein
MSTTAVELASPFAPFDDPAFQGDLSQLQQSVRAGWKRWAEEAVVIARLAAQVPRGSSDTRGATPWTSFVREVAVARRCSDQAAAKEVFLALSLTSQHPQTLQLLRAGRMPQWHARVLLEETAGCDARVVAAVDAEVADRACHLSPTRIREAVRRIELRFDADAAAAREAKVASARGVRLYPERDGQSSLVLTGPALPNAQFFEALTAEARALRAAGDPRGLDALRFDLAVGAADPAVAPTAIGDARSERAAAGAATPASWLDDRRRVRPVQVLIHLPVTTALGLSNDPGWLPGYGWISAPQCRQWLTSAALRQVCVDEGGVVVDVADRVVRPDPTPSAVRDALVAMIDDPGDITEKTYRIEGRHDPSPSLTRFVDLRDGFCDGPTGTRVAASGCDHDHELRYPDGPTAAWNLVARSARTHQLKHNGWTPLRTPTSTLWFSPAGQIVEVGRHAEPPPLLEHDAQLPDPDLLAEVDAELARPPTADDQPPWDEPPF